MQFGTKASLPKPYAWLLGEMQKIGYGRIENLTIRDGMPALSPAPRIVQEVKFGAENGPRSELQVEDFALKSCVRELFVRLSRLKHATILKLEIKGGLPFSMALEEHAA